MMKKSIWLFILLPTITAMAQKNASLAQPYAATDSIITFASSLYEPNSFLRRILMGKNYRKEWKTHVTLPVFYLSRSSFTIQELGGGMQTKSLHLLDRQGKEWALRSVDKDVTQAIPPNLRNRLTRKSSQDLISASFPYGAPIAGELVNAVGVSAARPQVFYVADDSAFGKYRSVFAHTVCTLEERDPGFPSTDNSEEVLANLTGDNSFQIQQKVFLKARLMDMLMADWDRHADNWRWGRKDSAGTSYYYAIPRDRDWVFYNSSGLIPKLVQLTGGMRCFVNFKPKAENIKNLSWKAWTLDRNLLNDMDAADWETTISEIQAVLTDSVIAAAVQTLPSSIYEMDGEKFIQTLKSRRDDLHDGIMKYYRFLAQEVVINGSDKDEQFVLSTTNDSLVVTIYRLNEARDKIYQRRFSPAETLFITLNGLGGDDVFRVDENAKSKIKLTINGGDGEDRYDIKGKLRVKINDTTTDSLLVRKGGLIMQSN